jgi:branched-subunit amino acid ABC-type transport system permease component
MDFAAVVVIQVLYAIASLALISIGLAIIFGMMRVINFAHGEFLMLGGYATVLPTHAGINLWVSMLVIAPMTVGLFGIVVERLIIRPLYGRIVETVLATWGLSLLLIGIVSSVIGFYQEGAAPPFGSVLIGTYHVSTYTLFVIAVTSVILLGVYVFLRFTHYGLIAQGTMQNEDMAAALGVNVDKVYAITFGLGAALSGLAGAILAPISGVIPIIGVTYIAKAFIVVVGGGATVLAGTAAASIFFGTISQLVTFATTPVIGEVALLAAAIVLLRLLPEGITGRFFRRGL